MKTDSQRAAYRVPSIATVTCPDRPSFRASLYYDGYGCDCASVYMWYDQAGNVTDVYGRSSIAAAIDAARAAWPDATIRRNR